MSDIPAKRIGPLGWLASRPRRFWIGYCLTLPLQYVVILPVAVWLHERSPPGVKGAIQWVYWPLEVAAKWSPYLSAILEWYATFGF